MDEQEYRKIMNELEAQQENIRRRKRKKEENEEIYEEEQIEKERKELIQLEEAYRYEYQKENLKEA